MKREAFASLILGAMVALLPLYVRVSTLDVSRSVKDNLAITLLALVCAVLPEKKRDVPIAMWIGLCVCLFLLIVNQWNVISLNVVIQQIYISVWACFFVRFYECFSKDKLHYILNGLSIGCIIQSILAIGDYFNISIYGLAVGGILDVKWNNFLEGGIGSAAGSLGNPNLLGSYLALSSFSLLRKNWIYFFPLATLGLIATGSLMAIFSFAAGMAYLVTGHKRILYSLAVVAMAGVWLSGGLGLDSGRVKIWNKSLESLTLKSFFIGHGPGWFPDQRVEASREGATVTIVSQEHNEFLSAFNIFGLAGVLIIIAVFLPLLKSDEVDPWSTILFAGFCNSFGHFTAHQSTAAIILVIAACVSLAGGNKHERNMDW